MTSRIVRIILPAAIFIAAEHYALIGPAYAARYMTIEEAQSTMMPATPLLAFTIELSTEDIARIEALSAVTVENTKINAWRSSLGDFFIVDTVLGKHELISYALSISAQGAIKQVEILEYLENYGSEIRSPEWRAQFIGKNSSDQLRLESDIKNISGATLSCQHISAGIKRALATYEIVLKSKFGT